MERQRQRRDAEVDRNTDIHKRETDTVKRGENDVSPENETGEREGMRWAAKTQNGECKKHRKWQPKANRRDSEE
jgi:hypothetical protein